MEAVITPHAVEQSVARNKQIRFNTPKKNSRGTLISIPSENFDTYAGLLNPPPRAMSLSASVLNHQYRQKQQPPLLPLPNVSTIIYQQQPRLSRSLSSQGASLPLLSRKDRTKSMSLTPKKSKPTKREEAKKRSATQSISEFLVVASPDPKDLPKHLPAVLTSKVLAEKELVSMENMDIFSESIFNLSPPPSSLPLPKFSLRSKLSCNAEAAVGVDPGATNNLRRLLRLR